MGLANMPGSGHVVEVLTQSATSTLAKDIGGRETPVTAPAEFEVAVLTGGFDRPYAFGLVMALVSKGICLDVIGSDEVDSPGMHTNPSIRFLNLSRRQRRDATVVSKASKTLMYYARLLRYAAIAAPKTFHILWNNKFQLFDRTLLMLYYKALGKNVVLTAHNVNQAKRDSNDSLLNRVTLRIQYRLADHIFVHTHKMKSELAEDFGVGERAITVLRHPVNNAFPDTDLTPTEAKRRLGITNDEKTVLFLGRISPYKGLEHLIDAFHLLANSDATYRLIIAGELKKGSEKYFDKLQQAISRDSSRGQILLKLHFIPDKEMELYLKAADALVLPYKEIFQSGVLFLAYSFGLPVIAADVGSFKEEILEGRTGFVCRPADPVDLAKTIETYFASDLYRHLEKRRREIREYANTQHSWDAVGELTRKVYTDLSRRHRL